MQTIEEIREIYSATLRLIALYKSHDLSIPFGLKGNLGEFYVQMELLKRFPSRRPDFRGGSFPGVDIFLDGVKIQVKTQIKDSTLTTFKGGYFDSEGSPTIKRATLDEVKADFLILVILYMDENLSLVQKTVVYVFDKDEFGSFSTTFCWSGKSNGDYTIVNILKVEGTPPTKLKEKIDFYDTPEYRQLFSESHDNWAKVERRLRTIEDN